MENMFTALWQTITMILLSAVGYIMYKTGKISQSGSKSLGNILIFLSLPCVIMKGFLVERTAERINGLLISALMAAIILMISIVISRLILGRHAIDNFAGAFSNPGFFGAPLIIASIGSESVFYIAAFIAFLNLLQWTYGVSLMKNSDENGLLISDKHRSDNSSQICTLPAKLLKAPSMIALLIGIFFFLTSLPVPDIIKTCITEIAGLNTPLAMFIIGIYMAQTDILKAFTKRRLYLVSLVRLIIIPLISIVLLLWLPSSMNSLRIAMLIAAACPVGNNVAVYAQLNNKDYGYAVETVVISTLLSIVTLPAIMYLAELLF